jgi:two-component system NtrC family sensor kinase
VLIPSARLRIFCRLRTGQVAILHVVQGPDKGRSFRTGTESALIGRTSEQIQLTDNSSSRSHAELRPCNGSWFLVDLGSANGTFLNGRRVTAPIELSDGDQIRIGESVLIFSGQDRVERLVGTEMIRERVDLRMGNGRDAGSSILSTVPSVDEGAVLQAPEAADVSAAWNVVYRVAKMISNVESVDALLNRVADLLFDHLVVDRLVVLLKDGEEKDLIPHVVRYHPEPHAEKPRIVTSRTVIQHVLETRDGVLSADAMNDERFRRQGNHDSIHRLGLRSIICVPILAHDEVLGVIHFDCSMSHNTYTQEQLRLAAAIGTLTGIAVENARLWESRMRTERLAAAGEAVAYLSHRIRNIVQGLRGAADVMEIGITKKDVHVIASGWSIMKRNLERMFHLTTNMLTFSKDRQPSLQPTQVNKIVEEVVQLVKPIADEASLCVRTELGTVPGAHFDPDGIHQVVHNILLNAVEAVARSTGRVEIATAHDVDRCEAVVCISDNGPGIPADRIEKIFDAFTSSKGHSGTGLGLAAAKKIVAEHGGEIEVDSAPGVGTTFRIRLPLSQSTFIDEERTRTAS